MRKTLTALVSASLIAIPMMTVSLPAAAKTVTQVKNEQRAKVAKQKTADRAAVRKANKHK